MRYAPRRPRRVTGFTLMELLIVMMIISILLAFILVAAVNATRAAEERATQALISKLDTGLADRLEALMNQRVDPTLVHLTSAYVYGVGRDYTAAGFSPGNNRDAFQRAGVLARYDQIKSEIPDAFVVQVAPANLQGGSVTGNYALNYGMVPFTAFDTNVDVQCVVPIGTGSSATGFVGTGIYGASYTIHAAINKNLGKYTDPTTGQVGAGFATKMFDGVDSNGDFFIDNIAENGAVDGSVPAALLNHKHVTARAEMLYALLVEGQGPYGSVFNRDDFTNREVRDTDQDGLPEFVDGWGNPIQFYRWPTLYHSDVQRGLLLQQTGTSDANGNAAYAPVAPYSGPFDTREQDPLDQNQELVMPDWWSSSSNLSFPYGSGSAPLSGAAIFFQTYFHQLVDPLADPSLLGSTPATSQLYWDRSVPAVSSVVLYPRRAFYSRYLILSAGPDGQPGVPYLTDPRFNNGTPMFTDSALKQQAATNKAGTALSLLVEGQAAQATLNRTNAPYLAPVGISNGGDLYTNQLQVDGMDDVTNHNLMSSGVPVQ
ncbi:MAG: type II secretion system protein [Isosphaeraceae bacterium]|nr:type II secretion system protein [Isosphaeraceae bacterium]